MDFLYSLYDALISINVPSEKARAVVDAMERDMGTTLATKKDLEALGFALRNELKTEGVAIRKDVEAQGFAFRKDLEALSLTTRKDLEVSSLAMKQELEIFRRDMDNRFVLVDQKFDALRSDLSRDIAASDLRITVKLGSMMVAGFGLTIAALRLWG